MRNLLIMTLSASLILAGCWNSRELNEVVIAIAVGIDKLESGEYRFTVQVINPATTAGQGSGGDFGTPVVTYSETGKSLFDAWRKITKISPRKVYFGHVRLLVIGEDVAREGIAKPLDPLLRDHEFRADYFLAIARKSSAKGVLSVLTALEKVPAIKLVSSLETSQKNTAETVAYTFDEIIAQMGHEGKDLIITGLRPKGSVKSGATKENIDKTTIGTLLQFYQTAVFKEDKLAGWFTSKETKGYNYVRGETKSTVEELTCPKEDGLLAVEIIRTNSDMKAAIKNEHPQITVNVTVEGNIIDVQCAANVTDVQIVKSLEKQLEQQVKGYINQAVKKQQKLKIDVLGFGRTVHHNNPKYWKEHKKIWGKISPSVDVNIQVEGYINNTGSIGKSLPK
ncbi:spore germination protein KC [Bacillus ectoiniformans]|uniref:Ger(x)C family spore germination protein n=1 Tax=Bacillus ectoiniformans TaxID=1494429 RepID=UPI00195BCF7C|nr:Ger(x)C family spore germination protein [Bacillus ectoiniformans]MBM7649607.1 spore germination protein KC [Bacillus ectoiniformans]